MIGRAMLAAAMAVTLLPAPIAMAQERSFACAYGNSDMNIINERASNFGMIQMLAVYRDRYDAAYARKQCEAFANGEPYAITCLDGQRDWDAIEASIPDDYYGMSTKNLTSFLMEERKRGTGVEEAYDYCREVGAVK